MFERSLWIIVVLAFSTPQFDLRAQEEETTTGNQLMFIPPPIEGALSLAVYDGRGKLVRLLKRGASIDSFKSGLNGLFVDWDRTDTQGKTVPAAKYYARGVAVGDVKIEGVAFHLNDWIDQTGSTRVNQVVATALLNDMHPALIADTPTRQLLIFDAKTAAAKAVPINFKAESLKSADPDILIFDGAKIAVIDRMGNILIHRDSADIQDADALSTRNIILTRTELSDQTGEGAPQQIKLPEENLGFCALLPSTVLVANRSFKLWKLNAQEFTPIELGETGELLDLEAGNGDTAWLLVKTANNVLLKQIDLAGKTLRDIELPADLAPSTRLAPSRHEDALLLISNVGPTQRTIGLRFQGADQVKSIWEKWLDRSITHFQYFDVKEGVVVATSTKTESPAVFIKPANNPLDNSRQPPFQLSVSADESGAWVTSSDGLPLFQVCKTKAIKQTRYQSDNANGMRLYISDGVVVEEYHLTNMDNLFRFDAGSFD